MSKDVLTPAEVAELLMVSPITVRQWADKGWLAALTTPGGHRRFLRSEVEAFARQRATPMRLLVVDDDVQLAGFLVEWLSDALEGCEVVVAHDGFEAGRKVAAFRPGVLLLDLMMPDMDGFQVCARLKADPTTRNIRVIAMTGYPAPENVARILAAGAEHCFAKPLDTAALLAAIRTPQPQSL